MPMRFLMKKVFWVLICQWVLGARRLHRLVKICPTGCVVVGWFWWSGGFVTHFGVNILDSWPYINISSLEWQCERDESATVNRDISNPFMINL